MIRGHCARFDHCSSAGGRVTHRFAPKKFPRAFNGIITGKFFPLRGSCQTSGKTPLFSGSLGESLRIPGKTVRTIVCSDSERMHRQIPGTSAPEVCRSERRGSRRPIPAPSSLLSLRKRWMMCFRKFKFYWKSFMRSASSFPDSPRRSLRSISLTVPPLGNVRKSPSNRDIWLPFASGIVRIRDNADSIPCTRSSET